MIICQILKTISKSQFFKEANKGSQNGSWCRMPTWQVWGHEFKSHLSLL
jgi:hypothetical protein